MTISNEKTRLLKLLDEGQISEKDFKDLSDALEKRPSKAKVAMSFIINPFATIDGWQAVGIGVIVLILTSLVGYVSRIHFPGILDLQLVKTSELSSFNLWGVFFQNLIAWATLALGFYLTAVVTKVKAVRIIDFVGMAALSRFPYLFGSISIYLLTLYDPSLYTTEDLQTFSLVAIALIGVTALIWQLCVYFNALKESTGLSQKPLWISFAAVLILGELVSILLTRSIL